MSSITHSNAIALLSELTGQSLQPEDLPADVIFMVAAVVMLSGVMAIDGTIDTEEEEHLRIVIDAFISPQSKSYKLMQLIIECVKRQQTYLNPHDFLVFADPLGEAERLLLVSLGYGMAATDGSISLQEILYLKSIAQRLHVPSHYLAVLEFGYTHQDCPDAQSLREVIDLLDPTALEGQHPTFAAIARNLLSLLPPVREIR